MQCIPATPPQHIVSSSTTTPRHHHASNVTMHPASMLCRINAEPLQCHAVTWPELLICYVVSNAGNRSASMPGYYIVTPPQCLRHCITALLHYLNAMLLHYLDAMPCIASMPML